MKKINEIKLPSEPIKVPIFKNCLLIAKNLVSQIIKVNSAIPQDYMSALEATLGSSLDILLSVYSSEESNKRMIQLVKQINNNFKILNDKINSREYLEILWRKVLKGTIETTRKEKIELFANAFSNFSANPNEIYFETTILNDIDSLEIEHVNLLNLTSRYREISITEASKDIELPPQHTFKFANDLLSKGLIIDPRVGTYDYGGFKIIKISDYGKEFIRSIKDIK